MPATSALSVPWPRYVSEKEPYNIKSTFTTGSFKIWLAMSAMQKAPAVLELDGPVMIGPIKSKALIFFNSFTPLCRYTKIFLILYDSGTFLAPIKNHHLVCGGLFITLVSLTCSDYLIPSQNKSHDFCACSGVSLIKPW